MHIYAVERPDGLVKIGKSSRPNVRIRAIETQGGFSTNRAWVSLKLKNASAAEGKAQLLFADSRTVGEWFAVDFDEAVNGVIESLDQWMIASAPTDSADPIHERVSDALEAIGAKQNHLAKAVGASPAMVSRWLSGYHQMSTAQIAKAAEFLKVSPSWLAFGDISSAPSEADAILATLTQPQRAQALRMLEAFAASIRSSN